MEISSHSPWLLIEINGEDQVLTGRIIESHGDISVEALYTADAPGKMQFYLIRPENTNLEEPANAIVDFAISPDVYARSFNFAVITHHPHNVNIKLSALYEDETVPLSEYSHLMDSNEYSVNLTTLEAFAPSSKVIERPERMLWAFYYPWFPEVGWDTQRSDNPIDDTSSRSNEDVGRQIQQAQAAGIDGFIVSHGSDWDDNRVEIIFDEADKRNFRIALYLEAADNPNERMWPIATLQAWIANAIDRYSWHPSFVKINGKPLIVIYMSRDIPLSEWTTTFLALESTGHDAAYIAMGYNFMFLDSFIGFHEYFVLNGMVDDPERQYPPLRQAVTNFVLLTDDNWPRIWAATVSPGFESYYGDVSPFIIDRGTGEIYRRYFEAAIAADADWIFITSWNEYGEDTHIEPGERYGDQYIQFTRDLAEIWKNR